MKRLAILAGAAGALALPQPALAANIMTNLVADLS
jgi:hypothetical protein